MRLALVVVSACLAAPLAAQTVHHVPQEHETIQGAVDVAANNDIILVSSGTYPESVTVTGKTGLVIKGKGKVVIDPPAGDGLTLDACTNCLVEKIRVGGGVRGFFLDDTNGCTLSKCRVDESSGDGIRVDGGDGVMLEKCTVTDAGGDGIALSTEVADDVEDGALLKCTVTRPAGDGIAVNGSFMAIEKCKVVEAGNDAFVVVFDSLSTHVTFVDCKALHPQDDGFVLEGDLGTALRCKSVGNVFGHGFIALQGSGHVFHECKSVKAANDAMSVQAAAADVTVEDCKISACGEDGLVVLDDGTIVSGCKVSGCDGNGVVVSADVCTFDGNSSKGNDVSGFLLVLGAAGNTLTGNVAKGNGNFDLEDQSGEVNAYTDNSFKNVGP